jgi:hypothetical protein
LNKKSSLQNLQLQDATITLSNKDLTANEMQMVG